MAYPGHPRGPLATAKYTSYLRRYKRSGLGLGTVKYVDELDWDDRHGQSGHFCAEKNTPGITTTLESEEFSCWKFIGQGVMNSDWYEFFFCGITAYSNGTSFFVDGVNRQDMRPGTASLVGKVQTPIVRDPDKVANDASRGNCDNCTKNYKYTITDTIKTEIHSIVVPNPTEKFNIKGYEWVSGRYKIESYGNPCSPSGFSCTCPDSTQQEKSGQHWLDSSLQNANGATRSWAGSNAGPFNPCKHIMAAKRLLNIEQSYGGYP